MKKVAVLLSLGVFLTVSCGREQESQVSNVSFTPCQQTKATRSELSDRVDVEFTNEGVKITHYNFGVTCDFTLVNVTHTFVNGVLNISQEGSPNLANCICYTDVSYTISGISQNEVNVIFINGTQVYCYNDKDDDTPQVQVSNITFTECINVKLYLPSVIFTVDFTNSGVNITHYLLDVNCAFDTVSVTQTFENGILTITEQGYPNSANCMCKANVSYTIGGISEKDIDKIVINGKVAWTANQQNSNCDQDVVISQTEYENAPNFPVSITDMRIVGNCLKIKFSASGCDGNTWVVKLIDWGVVAESIPCQRTLRLSLEDNEDCRAVIEKEVSFNIEDLQIQGDKRVRLNVSGNWILYEY